MKIAKSILAALGVLFIIFMLWAIFSPDEEIQTPIPTPTPIQTPTTLGTELEKGFIEGCNEDGESYAYCKCAYEYLDDRMTDRELLDMSVEYIETNELPEVFWDAVDSCMDKI